MSTVLVVLVVAAAGWLAASLARAYVRQRATGGGSVRGFARALDALDAASAPPGVRRTSRPRPRTARPRPGRPRPVGAARRTPHQPRTRRPAGRLPVAQGRRAR